MPWVALALAGASAIQQQQKQNQERQQAAIDTRYSPWTGIKPGQISTNGALGGAIQGAGAGLAFNQSQNQQNAWQDYLKNKNAFYQGQTNKPGPRQFTDDEYADDFSTGMGK